MIGHSTLCPYFVEMWDCDSVGVDILDVLGRCAALGYLGYWIVGLGWGMCYDLVFQPNG